MKTTDITLPTRMGELAAIHWENPGAPLMLCLHGWLDNAASFMHLAPHLTHHFDIIALDLPGHGQSAHLCPSAVRYHITDQVDYVLDALDYLDHRPVILVGHSLGGAIACLLAAAQPERVRQLISIDALGPLIDKGDTTASRWQKAFAEHARARRPARVFPDLDAAIERRLRLGDLHRHEIRAIVRRNLRACSGGLTWSSDKRLRTRSPLYMHAAQLKALMRTIHLPVLAIMAETHPEHLSSLILDAQDVTWPQVQFARIAGPHHLHIRAAEQVAQLILSFTQTTGVTHE